MEHNHITVREGSISITIYKDIDFLIHCWDYEKQTQVNKTVTKFELEALLSEFNFWGVMKYFSNVDK